MLTIPIVVLNRADYAIFAIGSAGCVFFAVRWWFGGRKDPLRLAPGRANRLDLFLVLACMIVFYLALMAAGLVAGTLPLPETEDNRWQTLFAVNIAQLVGAIACLVVAAMTFRGGLRAYGLGRRPILGDVAVAFVATLCVLPVCGGLLWISQYVMRLLVPEFEPPAHQVFQLLQEPEAPGWMRAFVIVGAGLIAPVAEELFFRGIVQTALRRFLRSDEVTHTLNSIAARGSAPFPRTKTGQSSSPGAASARRPGAPGGNIAGPLARIALKIGDRWGAIIVTGALFGCVHYSQPHVLVALTALGITLGYVYERHGSLVACIVMHAMFNGKSLLWYELAG